MQSKNSKTSTKTTGLNMYAEEEEKDGRHDRNRTLQRRCVTLGISNSGDSSSLSNLKKENKTIFGAIFEITRNR